MKKCLAFCRVIKSLTERLKDINQIPYSNPQYTTSHTKLPDSQKFTIGGLTRV